MSIDKSEPRTCVTYARYSSDRQSESSIEAQQAAMGRYIAAHGLTVLREYADRAFSGTNDNRPAFQRMLSELSVLQPDLVLVHKFDRFARNEADAYVNKRLIERHGARLVATEQDFGQSPMSGIMEAMMISMAAYYSRNLSAEVIKGKRVAMEHQRHMGGDYPFGYHAGPDGGMVVDEVEAYFVRKLYDACAEGKPYRTVVEEMEQAGVKGRRGARWSSGSINLILHNPVYYGAYKASTGGESVFVEGHHEPIISKERYEEVQKIMQARSNVGRGHGRKTYLCSGIAVCGCCGAPVRGVTDYYKGKEYSRYRCTGKGCSGLRSIPVATLDQAVCDYVNRFLTPELIEQLKQYLREYLPKASPKDAERRSRAVRADIAKLQKQIDNLQANLAAAVLPVEIISTIGEQIMELRRRIQILEDMDKPEPVIDTDALDEFFAAEAQISPDGDFAETLATIRRYVKAVIVHNTEIEIVSTLEDWLRENHPELLPENLDEIKASESNFRTKDNSSPIR